MDRPDFVLFDRYPYLRRLTFIDIESSGLIMGSYPIQYGWCGFDLLPRQVLIRPLPHWSPRYFEPSSVDVHGIRRSRLLIEGADAVDVARTLNEAMGGGTAFSDAVAWDRDWTDRLFDDTAVEREFALETLDKAFEQIAEICDPWCVERQELLAARVDRAFPHVHKADQDCLRLAALARTFIDRPFAEWLLLAAE
ncbi:hypothetical protein HFO56_24340 [Rhizobium laguerreae]|uniref:hypothetical protein n=1 Tax=Rhizobium laguerreae TaxID=1076926 RepID=UPI001C916AD3|nr:hypothetical protein [Rhizobium laguerreae]MBY3155460.1 hypothetical protein [Rhizobium laguerreae]